MWDYKEVCEEDQQTLLEIIPYSKISNCIVSGSGNIGENLVSGLKTYIKRVLLLSHESHLPITINYLTPETLGLDRLATAIGASHLFPEQNTLIIDTGTCITMDVLSENGVFEGGNITLGIQMRADALHDYTAKLPRVEPVWDGEWLGKSTERALQNGIVLGTILEVESFISHISKKYKDLKVLITGGDHSFFVDKIKTKIFAIPYLQMIGLNQIIKFNEKNTQ